MTPDTRTALETLLKECRTVLGFAQSWQPLTPGDLSDLRRAVDAASALLSTSPGEPELTDASALRAEIRRWACYCFTRHGHDAHLYNALAKLAGMEPPGADHGIECGFIGDPKQPDIYIELPDSCGDVMSEEDEYGKSD